MGVPLHLEDGLFRAIVEFSTDGQLVVDSEGIVEFANPAAQALFAIKTKTLVGFHLGIPADSAPVELIVPDSTGRRYLELRSHPIRLLDRTAHLATLRDVTTRVTNELSLKEALARQRAILDEAPIFLWTLDAAGRITTSEGRLLEKLGQRPGDSVGFSALELYRDAPQVVDITRRALRGESFHERIELQGLVIDIWYTPLSDEFGGFCGAIGVGVDVTEQVRLEQQSRQRHKMEAVGQLAGGVAHDFNNQLTVILGYAEMVLERVDAASPIWADLKEIQNAANRSKDLTQQLLAFSRRQQMIVEPVQLDEVVRGLEKMLKPLVPENIGVSITLAANQWFVKVDRTQIEQVLLNLVVNARDAMAAGGHLVVATSFERIDAAAPLPGAMKSGSYVVLTVSDTGHGMDQDTLNRIFEPFFTTKELGKGTGLGLATVYGIVKQMDGFITVDSKVGQGTTFRVHLPITSERPRRRTADEERLSVAHPGRESILVVEDEPGLRRFATLVLERKGYQVVGADSPIQALEVMASRGAVDLVLTDIVMPEMSGPDLVRKLELPATTAVCYMSGYSERDLPGTTGHGSVILAKPFTSSQLLTQVRSILDSWNTMPSLSQPLVATGLPR